MPGYRGKPVSAYVIANDAKTIIQPSQAGIFPRIFVNPSDTVSVVLQFPDGKAGDLVGVSALDGGSLDGTNISEVLTLNDSGEAELDFTVSQNQGVSRVAVQNGAQRTTLDFWAGQNNTFRVATSNLNSK